MTLDEKRKVVDDWIEKVIVRPAVSRPVTMGTVAARAGVSQSRVSQVFNGKANRAETIRRVKAAAEEVGYEWQARRWPGRPPTWIASRSSGGDDQISRRPMRPRPAATAA